MLFFELDAVFRYRARKEVRRTSRQVHIVLDDGGIHTTDDVSSSDVRWTAIDRVTENKEFWIVSRGTSTIKFIPKAKLAPAEQAELSEFMRQRRGRSSSHR